MGQYFQGCVIDLDALKTRLASGRAGLFEQITEGEISYARHLVEAEGPRRALHDLLAGRVDRADPDDIGLAVMACCWVLGAPVRASDVTLSEIVEVEGFSDAYPYAGGTWPLDVPETTWVLVGHYGPERCAELLQQVRAAHPGAPIEPPGPQHDAHASAVQTVLAWLTAAIRADQDLLLFYM